MLDALGVAGERQAEAMCHVLDESMPFNAIPATCFVVCGVCGVLRQ